MEQNESTENNNGMFGSKLSNRNRAFRTLLALMLLAATVLAVAWAIIYVTQDKGGLKAASNQIGTEVAVVEITAEGLVPASISISLGQQVKFINKDTTQHRIMADPESLQDFDSEKMLMNGDSYTYVFDRTGTYSYYDNANPQKYTGSVKVREQ